MRRKIILVSILTLIITAEVLAQSSNQDPAIGELQRQLEEMRSQMAKMQNRIAELEAAKRIAAANPSADPIPLQSQTPPAQSLRSQPDEKKSPEELTSFHYKGLTLTPDGFLESTILVRTRNENADMANSYRTIPLNVFGIGLILLVGILRYVPASFGNRRARLIRTKNTLRVL